MPHKALTHLIVEESLTYGSQHNGVIQHATTCIQDRIRTPYHNALQGRINEKHRERQQHHGGWSFVPPEPIPGITFSRARVTPRMKSERTRVCKGIIELGECALHNIITRKGQAKKEVRWEDVICAGIRDRSGEVRVRKKDCNMQVRDITRSHGDDRWQKDSDAQGSHQGQIDRYQHGR